MLDLHIELRDMIYDYLDFDDWRKLIKTCTTFKNDLDIYEVLDKFIHSIDYYKTKFYWNDVESVEYEINDITTFFVLLEQQKNKPGRTYNLYFNNIPMPLNKVVSLDSTSEYGPLFKFYKIFLDVFGYLDDKDKFTPLSQTFIMNGKEKKYTTAYCGRCDKLIQNYKNEKIYYNHQVSKTHTNKIKDHYGKKIKDDELMLYKLQCIITFNLRNY